MSHASIHTHPLIQHQKDPSCVLTGGQDGVLRVWHLYGGGKQASQDYSLDTGHTSSIYATKFLPSQQNLVATCSADRQVRLIDLESMRVKPYTAHQARVKALVAIGSDVLLSGGEDGTVRKWDIREPGPNASVDQQAKVREKV